MALAAAGTAGAASSQTPAAAPCTPAGKPVFIRKQAATVYCGPARATVRLGGRTMTFNGGTCVWTPSTFKVQLGTIFLFRNFARERGFEIRAAGYPVARALIQVYWDGTYYEAGTLHATARPNGSNTGGTFTRQDRPERHGAEHQRHDLLLVSSRVDALRPRDRRRRG